jgi:hypothetical protein
MNFNDAQAAMAQGSKVRRATWPPERFIVIGDPVSAEDQQEFDWVESSFVENDTQPPTPPKTLAGAKSMNIKVKEIKELKINAKVKGQEVEIDRLLSVEMSGPGADPIYNTNGKEASIEGVEVATGLVATVNAIVVVEGKKVELSGDTQPFDVVADEVELDAEGNPVPEMALTAELSE